MNDLELGWVVGLFEGEGCFSIQAFQNRTRRYPIAKIENADEDVMRRFASLVGVGTLRLLDKGEGRKSLWCWTAASKSDFDAFSSIVKPYLGQRRLTRLLEVEAESTAKGGKQKQHPRPKSVINPNSLLGQAIRDHDGQ